MEALAMTPKLLGRISNEEYQEKDRWKIDDIALGPANELLMSGQNLEIPKKIISLYKKDSGVYDNCPELIQNFDQPIPGEQTVLYLEGSSIIGLKVESALRLFSIGYKVVCKTLKLKQSPTCVCFYRGNIYTASNSSNIVSVCNLDLEDEKNIFLSDMKNDCVLEIVVVIDKICVCTKVAGRALVFSMTGSKEMEFENAIQTDAKATNICIHERTELVFVSWSNFQIQLYSQMTSLCLLAFDMTEKLHKMRVTAENILVTLSASKCILTVYDMGEAIKFGESQNTILSSVKKNNQKKLMSHDEEYLECHPDHSGTNKTFFFPPWKSASKQSKVEKLPDTKELYMEQLEENEIIRGQYERDVQKLGERITELEGIKTELESQQKKLKDTLAQEKEKVTRAEGSRDQAVTNVKKVEERNSKLEDEVRQLKETLLAEKETTKKMETSSQMLNERIKDLEDMKTELESQQNALKDTLAQEKEKVTRAEGSRSQVVTNLKKVEEMNTKLEGEVTELKERLLVEEKTTKEVQTSSLIAENARKTLEQTKAMLEKEKEYLTKLLAARERNETEMKKSLAKATTTCEKLQKAYEILQKEKEDLSEQLSTEKSNSEIQIASFSKAENARKTLEQTKAMLEKEKENLTKLLAAEERNETEMKKSLAKATTTCERLQKAYEILQKEKEDLSEQLSTEKSNTEIQIASFSKVVTNLKKVEEMNTKLEGEVTELKERLLVEEKTTKEMQTSSLKLNERIKDLEDMKTELESQQKKLRDTLDQEKDKVTRAEGSRIQLNERIKDLEDVRTELESQQKRFKDILAQEIDKLIRTEGSRIQAENARKTLEQTKAMLEKEKEYLTKLLAARERNETEMKKSLAKATTTCEKLQKAFEILQKEKEDLSEQLSTEKSNTEIQKASFSKMTSHALPGSEKMARRQDEDSYLCDETQSVITESTDSGRGSMHSGLEYHDPFTLNGRQLKTELKVAVTVTYKGANMHIPDTGVELDIPAGAVRSKVLIDMVILPFDKLDAPVSTFSCNSSVAVELLPNRMEFQRLVRLILPHCLKLTKNYKKTKNQVQVYVSHFETGPPIWEEVSNAKYLLDETNCVIYLKSFCWVKYEVNNKIVEAKRIRIYTAGNRLKYTEDALAEIEVGYHWDLPNARENLSVNNNMFVYQSKPFIFVKQGNLPLEILLTKTVPMQWKYITPEENPKVISFKCVADSKEKSCPFVIQKSEPTDRMPFCMFKVQQGNEDLELYIRFDD